MPHPQAANFTVVRVARKRGLGVEDQPWFRHAPSMWYGIEYLISRLLRLRETLPVANVWESAGAIDFAGARAGFHAFRIVSAASRCGTLSN